MMVYICTKFHENILNGIRVMEQTRKVNRRTDGRRARYNTTRLRWAYKNQRNLHHRVSGLQNLMVYTAEVVQQCYSHCDTFPATENNIR